jgi:nucleotide-binding universal stress UspA family protein
MIAIKNILVATDFSPESETALVYGRALAGTFGATLHVIHVVDDSSTRLAYADFDVPTSIPLELQTEVEQAARRQLEAFVSEGDRRNLHAMTVLEVGNHPANEIVDYAKHAAVDIIVLGATGRGVFNRMLMGSVADKVLRLAPCPVLAVRHPEREFVVPEALRATANA